MEKLEEELAKLKRIVEDRDLDWVDMRGRCKRLLDRTRKYVEAHDAVEEAQPLPNNGGAGAATPLFGRAAEAQRRILARRTRLLTPEGS